MSTPTSQDLRCPRCAAQVRAGSDWCTLCYSDLRPPPAEPVAPESEPTQAGPGEALPVPPVQRPRGKHARRAVPDPTGDPLAGVDVDAMLAQLAAAEGGAPLGRFSRHVDSKGKQMAVMAGGALVAAMVILVLFVVFGALL